MRLTPLGMFVKWVLIPLLVAAIGYLVVAPRLGARSVQPVRRLLPIPNTRSSS